MGHDTHATRGVAACAGGRRRAFSLVEIAMVLAVIGVLIAAVMLFLVNATEKQKLVDTFAEISAIRAAVQSLYSSQPDYSGINSAVLVQSGLIPQKWVSGGNALSTPFHSSVVVYGGPQYTILMYGIPQAACMQLVMNDYGRDMASMTADFQPQIDDRPMTMAEARAECGLANGNMIFFTFR